MKRLHNRLAAGFTLIELMILVVIMGVLAAIAVPAFTRYVRRSKTSEALGNIQKIMQGEVTYYQASLERGGTSFLSCAYTPSTPPSATKYPANVSRWTSDPNWTAVGFSLSDAHYYQYYTLGDGVSVGAAALGDLDGDGIQSTFNRVGYLVAGDLQFLPVGVFSELE